MQRNVKKAAGLTLNLMKESPEN